MKRVFWFSMLAWLGLALVQGQSYTEQSVLSQGQWYKIGVRQTGMVKLDQTFLAGLGIDVNGLNPRNLQIYGNGGGLLPQRNDAFRHDDLVQNPIQVVGEGDGSFDANDHIIFFAQGPHTWRYDEQSQAFRHQQHFYSDTNFYFLHLGGQPGLRVSEAPSPGSAAFDAELLQNYHFHEREAENPINSGRVWLGERLDLTTQRSFRFYLPDAKPGGNIEVKARVAARSDLPTFFTLSVGGQVVANTSVDQVSLGSSESIHYKVSSLQANVPTNQVNGNDSLTVVLEYNPNGSSRSEGWLDWIEVNYDQAPDLGNRSQWMGSLEAGVAPGQVARLRLRNGSSSYQVWDVTNPVQARALPKSVNGNTLEVTLAADSITQLVAFRDAPLRPVSGEAVPNQNLHGLGLVDYLVITNQTFQAEAERLADFHRNHYGRSAAVVRIDQIYNEFSSGKPDVSAIRDFIRMLYVRSLGMAPGFVCIFGDGTYIYKDISEARNRSTNFVPTYQSRESRHPTRSFTSDDFYVMLEDDEGFWGEKSGYEGDAEVEVNTLDAAIGRLPVENVEQAQQIVDKIIRYATEATYGTWRNKIVLVADHRDNDGTTHVSQSDGYTSLIEGQAPCMELEKLYMDNYRMVITAGNESFPEGRDAVLRAMDEGSLLLNYTGHGSENAWSYSRIFKNSDIDDLDNQGRYPAIVTATCEFGRYDNPEKRSGAELFMMHPDVGAIAMFTTVRLVYASPNRELNANFYRHVFDFDSLRGRRLTMGEVMRRTKNSTFVSSDFTNINSRNFTLLGDPGLILNYPEKRARITHINERPVDPARPDSLQSLGLVSVEGVVEDELGQPLPDFSGEMEVTVFDKPSTYTTKRAPFTFDWQNNRIFNGRALVRDGAFRFEFVVPIDISYEDGTGKISTYFSNQSVDGAGCYDNLYVGGTDANALVDTEGPEVALYINDSLWREGNITSQNPDLFAIVSDENGINTTGTGIGHEISAVLDDNDDEVFILNDYYIADPGNYRRGQVRYPLENLAPGRHTLRIRVWDVANNASEDETTFIVADNAQLALEEVLNYPNPFNPDEGSTTFRINHNLDGQPVRMEVEIFAQDGRIISQLNQEITPGGNLTQSLAWDGTTAGGAPIASGVYIYRVRLINLNTGQEAYQSRRLVVIR
jgi:hypothetical protein